MIRLYAQETLYENKKIYGRHTRFLAYTTTNICKKNCIALYNGKWSIYYVLTGWLLHTQHARNNCVDVTNITRPSGHHCDQIITAYFCDVISFASHKRKDILSRT
jgi:hypothetical protein